MERNVLFFKVQQGEGEGVITIFHRKAIFSSQNCKQIYVDGLERKKALKYFYINKS